MELRLYDENLNRIMIIEEYKSLLWTRKYYEPGNFTLVVPLTAQNLESMKRGRIIYKSGAKEAGIIEYIQRKDTPQDKSMTIKGRFLSSLLDRRVLTGTRTVSGKSEEIMRNYLGMVTPIPGVELGELQGFEDTLTKQTTYKNLLDIEKKIAKKTNHAFRIRPDMINKKMIFEIYDGVDRSMGQHERGRVIFSDEYANLNEITQTVTDSIYKTIAYVGGAGEGSARKFVTVGDTSGSGLARREVFIDARHIQQTDGMTDAQYLNVLRAHGEEKLAEMILSEAIDSKTNPMLNFVYMEDYDLGDIVTIYKPEWGINKNLRITEIMEQYNAGGATLVPTFGDPLPGIEWSESDE